MTSEFVRQEATADLRRETEQRLKQDEEKLKFFQDIVNHLTDTSNRMEPLLDTCLQRLDDLQSSIGPIYTNTAALTRAQENIQQVSKLLEPIERYYALSGTANKIIQCGPSQQLNNYLDTLKEIEEAIRYFEENNPENPERAVLTSLRDRGHNLLIEEFNTILENHSCPLRKQYLDEHTEEQLQNIKSDVFLQELPTPDICLSPETCITLKTISEWMMFSANYEEDCIQVTTNLRRNVVEGTLSFLDKRTMKTMVGQGQQSHTNSPLHAMKKGMLQRTSSVLRIRKQSQHSFAHGKLMLSNAKEPTSDAYEKGTEPLLHLLDTCLVCLRHESAVLDSFFPRRHQTTVLSALAQYAFEVVCNAIKDLILDTKEKNEQQQYFSTLSAIDVFHRLYLLKVHFFAVFDRCSKANLTEKYHQISLDPHYPDSLADTVRMTLLSFQESVSIDPAQKLPKDGTVHELTSRGMKFVGGLLDYCEGAASALVRNGHASGTEMILWVSDDEAVAVILDWISSGNFAIYYTAYIHALQALFGDIEIDSTSFSELLAMCSEAIQVAKEQYQRRTWERMMEALVVDSISGPLSKREKDVIKDRYTRFNEELERIQTMQQDFAIPNKELQKELIEANIDLVLPRFRTFHETYSTSGFSQKNPHRYIRYSPDDVERIIRCLLGGNHYASHQSRPSLKQFADGIIAIDTSPRSQSTCRNNKFNGNASTDNGGVSRRICKS
eukprot:gene7606-9870_t